MSLKSKMLDLQQAESESRRGMQERQLKLSEQAGARQDRAQTFRESEAAKTRGSAQYKADEAEAQQELDLIAENKRFEKSQMSKSQVIGMARQFQPSWGDFMHDELYDKIADHFNIVTGPDGDSMWFDDDKDGRPDTNRPVSGKFWNSPEVLSIKLANSNAKPMITGYITDIQNNIDGVMQIREKQQSDGAWSPQDEEAYVTQLNTMIEERGRAEDQLRDIEANPLRYKNQKMLTVTHAFTNARHLNEDVKKAYLKGIAGEQEIAMQIEKDRYGKKFTYMDVVDADGNFVASLPHERGGINRLPKDRFWKDAPKIDKTMYNPQDKKGLRDEKISLQSKLGKLDAMGEVTGDTLSFMKNRPDGDNIIQDLLGSKNIDKAKALINEEIGIIDSFLDLPEGISQSDFKRAKEQSGLDEAGLFAAIQEYKEDYGWTVEEFFAKLNARGK
jgi:hypothetical protein